ELIAQAFDMANRDELDIVHVYTNEEDIALPFAKLCTKPVVFTHHDPFNFLVKYKNVFPKYKDLNWISMSMAQRAGMPEGTNWVGNVYHGIDENVLSPVFEPAGNYIAYLGRIIEPKGVHLAIDAVKRYNQTAARTLKLKIAGKHYAGHKKDTYWQERIEPLVDGNEIEYVGFIDDMAGKQEFLGNAKATIMPSLFDEPFGLVMIESLACGTPVIGLNSGAIPEVIRQGSTGVVVDKTFTDCSSVLDDSAISKVIAEVLPRVLGFDRRACRSDFEERFTAKRMCREHLAIYNKTL
ncbi:MAG TPA: glycosyltransferase, partial [Candidatus Saccharimonadales bacterium]